MFESIVAEGFCEGYKKSSAYINGHEIFLKIFDGPQIFSYILR